MTFTDFPINCRITWEKYYINFKEKFLRFLESTRRSS